MTSNPTVSVKPEKVIKKNGSGKPIQRVLKNPLGVIALVWLFVLLITSFSTVLIPLPDPQLTDLSAIANRPSSNHLMGTDSVGRDVLSRLLHGGRITLISAALASGTAIIIGVPLGLVAGFYGRGLDGATSWLTNLLMSLPSIVVLLALRAAFGPSIWISMIAFGILLSPSFFRLARAATQGVRKELYVDAAIVSGLSDTRIIVRHILSVVRAPIIIQAAMVGGMAISIQSGLDFLGLGDPAIPSWGVMLSEAFSKIYQFPQLLIAPGISISGTIASLAILANALRDALEDAPAVAGSKRLGRRQLEYRRSSPAEEQANALIVEALEVGYKRPTGEITRVVHGVSLEIKSGEVLGLVGESGSGKTQIALAVLGLIPQGGEILNGSVTIQGDEDVAGRLGEIGYVPQEPMTNLDPSFTIGHQLVRPLVARHGFTRKAAEEQVRSLLKIVGIADPVRTMNAYPHEISGGMAQRVLIAGAVAPEPKLLVADEPTTALDVTVQAEVLDVLRTLQEKRQMAMLLVTHNFGVVADLCDRVAVMQEGLIVEVGDVRDVLKSPKHPYTQKLLGASIIGRRRGEPANMKRQTI